MSDEDEPHVKPYGDVMDFGKLRLQRGYTKCLHRRMAYSTDDEIVECQDCGVQLSPFKAFMLLINNHKNAWDAISRHRSVLNESLKKSVILRAAKKAEKAWRSRKYVPTCPHCDEAIFPEDNFGDGFTGKELAKKRRSTS